MGEINRAFFDTLCENATERRGKKQIPGISRVLSVRFEMREERVRAAIAALECAGYIAYDKNGDLATILDPDAPRSAVIRKPAPSAAVKKKRHPSAKVRGKKTLKEKTDNLSTAFFATAFAQLEQIYIFLRDLKNRMARGGTLTGKEKKLAQRIIAAQKWACANQLVPKKTTPLQVRRIILQATAAYFCVETKKLYWRKRHHARNAFARHVAIFIMRTQFAIDEQTIASHLRCAVDLVQDAVASVQKRYARGDESVRTPIDDILLRLRSLREKIAALAESSVDTA